MDGQFQRKREVAGLGFEQRSQLERAKDRIGYAILQFFALRQPGDTFTMQQLCGFVQVRLGGAPDSPSRVMRDLRQRGRVAYSLVSRKDSLYRVEEKR